MGNILGRKQSIKNKDFPEATRKFLGTKKFLKCIKVN